ncbi:MAG: undecaprenyl-phosphate glucose phosphotransferase [Cytophagales bacterium]
MGKQYNRFLRVLYFSGDLVVVNLAFVLAFVIRFNSIDLIFDEDYFRSLYYPLFLVYNLSWVLISIGFSFYRPFRFVQTRKLLFNILKVFIFHLAIMTVYFILAERKDISRQFFFSSFLIYLSIMFVWRLGMHFFFRISQSKGLFQKKVIIVGFGEVGKELYQYFSEHPELGSKCLGFFDSSSTKSKEIIGNLEELDDYLISNEIDEVYCSLPDTETQSVQRINEFCQNNLIRFSLIPDFRSFYYKRVKLDFYNNIPVLSTLSDPLTDPFNRFIKRAFDILFSLFVIVFILSWLIPILVIIIKIDSKGPGFFVQSRSGFKNNVFKVYKLRTMVVNQLSDSIQASKDDRRITRIGSFLRKTSLDELPQFFNVLIGEMSIVGPRPHMLFQTAAYSQTIDNYMIRHFVKPGITGLAQVNGYRGETADPALMKTRVKMDKIYIEHWSLWLDIKIIFETALLAFKKQDYAY